VLLVVSLLAQYAKTEGALVWHWWMTTRLWARFEAERAEQSRSIIHLL
jgi:hypothetical protein